MNVGVNYLWNVLPPEECLPLLSVELGQLYLGANDGAYPDLLKDGNNLRRRRAKKKTEVNRVYGRLKITAPEGLKTITIPINGGILYCHATTAEAKEEARLVLGHTPSYVKLERSRPGNIHLHVVTDARVPTFLHSAPLPDLEGFAAYLSKPCDAKCCAWEDKKTGFYYAPKSEEKLEALGDWVKARARANIVGVRLPWTSWPMNIPQNRTLLNYYTG